MIYHWDGSNSNMMKHLQTVDKSIRTLPIFPIFKQFFKVLSWSQITSDFDNHLINKSRKIWSL